MIESLSVLEAARDAGNAPFLIHDGGTLTFSDAARRVAAWCSPLRARGATRGQERPIAFVMNTDVPSVLLLLSLFELRVPALLLHPRWTAAERERVLAQGAGTRRAPLFVETSSFDFDASAGASCYDDTELRDAGAERIAAIVFTSGSSGEPRGVMLSERAFSSAAAASAARLRWFDGDVWALSLPACHIGGLSIVTRCLLGRKALAFEGSHRVDSRQTGTLCTLSSWVPTQLHRVLEANVPCPPELRAVLVGGAAAAPSLVRRGLDAGYPILLTYGSSEMGSQIATQLPGRNSTEHCGPPLDGVEVSLREGRLWLRGPMLASGYYPDEPLPTNERGFYETSDLASLDEDGNLRLLGRADDVIVTGGENVSPLEVEAALVEHPDVRAVCVFGREDAEFGQRVCAAVVTHSGGVPDDLSAWLATRLAGYKRPRSFWVLAELPLLANGKVDRRAVKERTHALPRSVDALHGSAKASR